MSRSGNHIISKLKWDTSFDQQEQAKELQNNLSVWSNHHLEKEITKVFDALCPQEQTWKIKSLELDLGTIHFDVLENELSLKFSRQLREKLVHLINHSTNYREHIEIFQERGSYLEMIQHFLLRGFMPWNYNPTLGTINQILSFQLRNNGQKTILMLRQIGKYPKVTKRMGLQINAANLNSIIKGLEPYHYKVVFNFSKTLVRLHKKSGLFSDSHPGFKKNVSLWMLHYLMAERGVLFNKMDLTLSILRQMQQQYKLNKKTLDKLWKFNESIKIPDTSKTSTISSALKTLLEENSKDKKKLKEDPVVFWHSLKELFMNASLRKKAVDKKIFNELIIQLSNKNKTQFIALLSGFGTSNGFWSKIVKDAKETSLEIIISTLRYSKAPSIITSIVFLNSFLKSIAVKVDSKIFWRIGLLFALKHKNTPFTDIEFLEHCISVLGKTNALAKAELSEQLMGNKINPSLKTAENVVIYRQLASIFTSSLIEKELRDKRLPKSPEDIKLNQKTTFQKKQKHAQKKSTIAAIIEIINTTQNQQAKVSKTLILSNSILKADFYELCYSPKGKQIICYLIPEGIDLLTTLLTIYEEQLNKLLKNIPKKAIKSHICEIYWRCISDYTQHNGKEKNLKKVFKEAIEYRFTALLDTPIADRALHTVTKSKEPYYFLKNGLEISSTKLYFLIHKNLNLGRKTIIENGVKISMSELLVLGLEASATETQKALKNLNFSTAQVRIFKSAISYDRFMAICTGRFNNKETNEGILALNALFQITKYLGKTSITKTILDAFWKTTLLLIASGEISKRSLKELMQFSFNKIPEMPKASTTAIIKEIEDSNLLVPPTLKKVLAERNKLFLNLVDVTESQHPSEDLQHCIQKEKMEELCYQMLTNQRIPPWFYSQRTPTLASLWKDILLHYPMALYKVLKYDPLSETQINAFCKTVPFNQLLLGVRCLNPGMENSLSSIEKCHEALGHITLPNISADEVQHILHKKVLIAWKNHNWKMLASQNIWNEILWEVCVKRGVPKASFLTALGGLKTTLPPAYLISLDLISDIAKKTMVNEGLQGLKLEKLLASNGIATIIKEGIAIKNAGMVVLNSYIPVLFERLGLLKDAIFKNETCQLSAVHYLQYLVSGLSYTEEAFLPLNKVLSGVDIVFPVSEGITISKKQQKIINGLILAASQHWSCIGDTSINGFRGNWLVRDGILSEQEDRWELVVEKKAYDLLINQSPFSFSIIKYPWMKKPLHVKWPY